MEALPSLIEILTAAEAAGTVAMLLVIYLKINSLSEGLAESIALAVKALTILEERKRNE